MRSLLALAASAFLALCLLAQGAQDAHAQMGGGMGGGRGKPQDASPSTKNDKAPKADDNAYKDALKRIPEKKTDPWGSMR